MELFLDILPILLLLMLSAFFSGSETAMTAASQPRMLELERQEVAAAGMVNRLRARTDRLIGAILFGNNLVNILASALATGLFIGWFGQNGVFYATIVMTLLVLIFAEVMPKAYAINHADSTALRIAPVLRAAVSVLAPAAQAIQLVVEGTFRLFGVRFESALSAAASEEELRGAIRMHAAPEPDPEVDAEREMLSSILDLGDVEVEEIMTHRSNVAMIDADRPAPEVVKEVLASPYTRLPVFKADPDNIVGVLHAKDLLRAVHRAAGDVESLNIRKIAATPWFIPESTALLDQLHAFRERREHFATVVDEYGAFMGIVTLEDILEEIVGDIADEHDRTVAGVRAGRDGSLVVNGDVTIRDLNREYGWDLPDEHAATVAGLVMHEARRIPEVRQVFAFHGFRFEILRRRGHRVTSIRVARLDDAGAAAGTGPDTA